MKKYNNITLEELIEFAVKSICAPVLMLIIGLATLQHSICCVFFIGAIASVAFTLLALFILESEDKTDE